MNKQWWTSASKLAFLLVVTTTCVGFFFGKLSENNFMILAGSAFAFYFTTKVPGQNTNISLLPVEKTNAAE